MKLYIDYNSYSRSKFITFIMQSSMSTVNTQVTQEQEIKMETTPSEIYKPDIPEEIWKWICDIIDNPETDVIKLRENFFETFPHLKENLDFSLASKIDYEFNSTIGVYWMESYSNPKRGDYVNIFDKDRWVKQSGIFTFRVIDYDSDDDYD